MLSFEQVRTDIRKLRELTDPEDILSGIKDIFYNIMCADQPFYLVYQDQCPLLSPALADSTHRFLQIFSHKELADKYAEQHEDTEIQELQLMDFLQISRWAFLSGGYGVILNEGSDWIGTPISDLLTLFFTNIYRDGSLIDLVFVEAITFINELRINSVFQYGAIFDDEGNWTGEVVPGQLPAITPQSLFRVPTDSLIIKDDDEPTIIPSDILARVMPLCGYSEIPTAPSFIDEFKDAPIPSIPFIDEMWKVSDPSQLALNFSVIPEQPPLETAEEGSGEGEVIHTAKPVPVEKEKKSSFFTSFLKKKPKSVQVPVTEADANEAEHVEEDSKIHSAKPVSDEKAKTSFFAKFYKRKMKSVPIDDKKTDEEVVFVDPGPEQPFEPEIDPTLTDSAPVPDTPLDEPPQDISRPRPLREDKKERVTGKKRVKKPVVIAIIAVASIALIVSAVLVFSHIQYKENVKHFQRYVNVKDYVSAYALYKEVDFGNDVDEFLADSMDTLILQYAENEISAKELAASLKALSNFTSISHELEIARLTASKLEESKNAYVRGREAADVYEKLNAWRQVVQLDTVNYAAVRQSVEDNSTQYIDVLRADIEYYRTRMREFAKDRYDVLTYWYPESEYLLTLSREFGSEQSAPLSYYPIKISNISIRQESNAYWTMYIDWTNLSVKTIDSICFSVVAVGEDGKIITCKDVKGEWVIFDATDSHRYEPGENPSDSAYYWHGVFYGPNVRDVQLTAVNIYYRDGSVSTYTSETDLSNMK